MFEQTFVPEESKGSKPFGLVVSFVAQILLLGLVVVVPLLVTRPAPAARLHSFMLGRVPDATREKPAARNAIAPRAATYVKQFRLTVPIILLRQADRPTESPTVTPDVGLAGVGIGGDWLSGGMAAAVPESSVPPSPPKEMQHDQQPRNRLAIGGSVAAGNLVRKVEPVYPVLARMTRTEGLVIFEAVISTNGEIRDLQLKEGHPLLVEAARTAILQWRYRPTLLNGRPVEVLTTITIRFSLAK